jgi:hypothetical protein
LKKRKELSERNPYPSEEKERLFEKEIELLWEKIVVHKKYSTEEQNLRIKAVEALRKHEEQLFRKVREICLPPEESNEESAKSNKQHEKDAQEKAKRLAREKEERRAAKKE